jgi:hypothetical protein
LIRDFLRDFSPGKMDAMKEKKISRVVGNDQTTGAQKSI